MEQLGKPQAAASWHGIRPSLKDSMARLKDKIKIALDESRMLVLGTQILLGFQFRVVFEPAFDRLPASSQYLKMAGLVVLLIAIGLIMAPGSFHRIVRSGSDAEDVQRFTTGVMDFALVPFTLALMIDLYVATGRILGVTGGVLTGALIGGVAVGFWYALGLLSRSDRAMRRETKEETTRAQPTSLKDKIDQALTEARVVLPGAQALLGFQFVTMFMDGFEKLPNSSKYLHIASLVCMALTMVLLMAPAAYHRIATAGEDTRRVHQVASGFLLAAMTTLPLGIAGDVYIVFLKVSGSAPLSVVTAIGLLIFFYGLWFGFTSYRRFKLSNKK